MNNNIITPTIKSLFGGKVDENIKLNKINEKLELFPFEKKAVKIKRCLKLIMILNMEKLKDINNL